MPTRTGVKITKIKAINTMASYIGIPPISSLNAINQYPDLLLAQQVLDEMSQTVLASGLPCNVDYNYVLDEVDIDGIVIIPDGALICDIHNHKFRERDGRVYDVEAMSYHTGTGLQAYVIWDQEFDYLPELVKRYITVSASRSFVSRVKGDQGLLSLTIPDEIRTKNQFQEYVNKMSDVSLLDDPDLAYISFRKSRRFY